MVSNSSHAVGGGGFLAEQGLSAVVDLIVILVRRDRLPFVAATGTGVLTGDGGGRRVGEGLVGRGGRRGSSVRGWTRRGRSALSLLSEESESRLTSLGLRDRHESFCCTLLREIFVFRDLIEPNEERWLAESFEDGRETQRAS